jgi:hypothetical protein
LIHGSTDRAIYIQDGGMSVCESIDDADVISLELKIELEDVRKNIGTLAIKAVRELNMGNIVIQRQYGNYVR